LTPDHIALAVASRVIGSTYSPFKDRLFLQIRGQTPLDDGNCPRVCRMKFVSSTERVI
jgi:hypothetical protein